MSSNAGSWADQSESAVISGPPASSNTTSHGNYDGSYSYDDEGNDAGGGDGYGDGGTATVHREEVRERRRLQVCMCVCWRWKMMQVAVLLRWTVYRQAHDELED